MSCHGRALSIPVCAKGRRNPVTSSLPCVENNPMLLLVDSLSYCASLEINFELRLSLV